MIIDIHLIQVFVFLAIFYILPSCLILQDHFAEYYSSVMPYLKVIMMTANEELDHSHLADSVECITMVWLAVGKDKIRSDIEMVWSITIFVEI